MDLAEVVPLRLCREGRAPALRGREGSAVEVLGAKQRGGHRYEGPSCVTGSRKVT